MTTYRAIAGASPITTRPDGLSLADHYAAHGPAIGDRVRITTGPERGVSLTVAELDGWLVSGFTPNGRTLNVDVTDTAPIAAAIVVGR